ncbi:hypothetical protein N657DRAFT_651299 [Parathielavia appendiculata]|uniref:Subtilisin-like serine protease n=1 Tax=Parathielavia appendiculata TaxID=2587402 RepID=A0AAN6TQV2_9PEZI|nr:hypothetical protein N657DRAFT_651299 [Parathielavia appendiculata]
MGSSPPFPKEQQLCTYFDREIDAGASAGAEDEKQQVDNLPGWPCVSLSDRASVEELLYRELYASDLETVAPRLWIMSTQSSANVEPLHQQRIKGREILITESPRLHLVWIHNRIFVKPIPKYLLSHRFWEQFLLCKPAARGSRHDLVQRAATGYLRSYRYLIQHESDFDIGKQVRLIPQNFEWPEFCRFIMNFSRVGDMDVSSRYHYGELRLSRLNLYAPFLFGKFNFQKPHWQYSDYFARFYGPMLFIFAVASTVLSSMQLEMAVEQVSVTQGVVLWSICRWTSTVILVGTTLIALGFWLLWVWLLCDEWVYALRCRAKKRREMLDHSSRPRDVPAV